MIESISAFDTQKSAQNECDQAKKLPKCFHSGRKISTDFLH